jgi:biopolymer transport protein ExbD
MAFDRWRRATEDAVEINVIPVMNLFMVLIPFLLLGATFFHIGVIPTSTPTLSPSDSDVPKTPTTVAVNLEITQDLLRITASSVSLEPEELEALSAEWPKKNGEYQVDALQRALVEIKQKYPESNTLTVLPFEDLNYQVLVSVLDVTRNRQVGLDAKGEPKIEDIFPVTIFSRFVPDNLVGENANLDEEGQPLEPEDLEE